MEHYWHTTFLGKDTAYWMELQQRAEELKVDKLIEEISMLRGKISFYESRLDELHNYMVTMRKL